MLDQLDALLALHEEGTTSAAAAKLRVGQSTISKRIATLEARLGRVLHEPDGRGCRLTASGELLVARTARLVAELRAELAADVERPVGRIVLACSESILASWGAACLANVQARVEGIEFEFHAHRSPMAIERVRSGRCHVALVAGDGRREPDLAAIVLGHEEMVVIPSRLEAAGLARLREIGVWTIEESSSTWASIRGRMQATSDQGLPALRIVGRLESFTALVQFAIAGFGHALVPKGIGFALGIDAREMLRLRSKSTAKAPLLRRKISWIARKATLGRDPIASVGAALEREMRALGL